MGVSVLSSCLSPDQSKKQPVLEEKGLDEARALLLRFSECLGFSLRHGGTGEDGVTLHLSEHGFALWCRQL